MRRARRRSERKKRSKAKRWARTRGLKPWMRKNKQVKMIEKKNSRSRSCKNLQRSCRLVWCGASRRPFLNFLSTCWRVGVGRCGWLTAGCQTQFTLEYICWGLSNGTKEREREKTTFGRERKF